MFFGNSPELSLSLLETLCTPPKPGPRPQKNPRHGTSAAPGTEKKEPKGEGVASLRWCCLSHAFSESVISSICCSFEGASDVFLFKFPFRRIFYLALNMPILRIFKIRE